MKSSSVGQEWQYSTVHNSACKVIERVGLPEVRQFRLSRCDADESEWRHELQSPGHQPRIGSMAAMRRSIAHGWLKKSRH
jgi:hypothetical protein